MLKESNNNFPSMLFKRSNSMDKYTRKREISELDILKTRLKQFERRENIKM